MSTKAGESQEEALKRAFRFLSYRPRSRAEVQAKLCQLGFSPESIEPVLQKLSSLNLLNDESFARNWTRVRGGGRGYGPLRIERELVQKGIAPSIIREVLRETFDEGETRERARALLKKRFHDQDLNDARILRRAVSFLLRLGYRKSVIAEVLRLRSL